jgi:hypothetical protein
VLRIRIGFSGGSGSSIVGQCDWIPIQSFDDQN